MNAYFMGRILHDGTPAPFDKSVAEALANWNRRHPGEKPKFIFCGPDDTDLTEYNGLRVKKLKTAPGIGVGIE